MESSSHGSPSKRGLEDRGSVAEGETREKRARITSDISETSEQLEEVAKTISEGSSPPEVIYELSSDNDESLLNVTEKEGSNEASPVRSEKNVRQDEENDVKMKSESGEEDQSEDDEDSDKSSESDDNDSDEHRVKVKTTIEKNIPSAVEDLSSEEESYHTDKKQMTDILPDTRNSSSADTQKKSTVTKERRSSHSSVDEVDYASNEVLQEKRKKRLESSDYNTKTMEDLEDLQEDLHKELAEITEKSQQKRSSKHKKGHLSREKRHKEKTTSRHKEREGREVDERERQKEREKRGKDVQRSNESRSSFRREVTVGTRKEHEKGRKYLDDDDNSRRGKKDERKDRVGDRHRTQSKQERPSSRTEVRSVVERKVRKEPKVTKDEEPRSKQPRAGQTSSKEIGKEPKKKGIMSDSMRELVRQSIKESKGFAQEVVEEVESDESPEHFFKVQTTDVSSASETEDEPVPVERPASSPEVPKLPPYLPAILGCRSVEEFQWLNRIEEGTYGVVYRAKDKRTDEVVALKKLKMEKEKEGFPITSLREINTLLKAQHPNIVTVQEIVVGSNMDKIYIVMDFVEHDLKALMESMTQPFLAGEIKTIMIQLLRAVNHLHDNWILHRDIKTSNLLLSNKGILKVGDFGLAREYGSPLKAYTPIVVTLWYRAPELLLGAKEYSTPIDLWSVGCVFAELLTMKPLFNGQSEISQINKIFKELGTPSDKIWPGPPAYSELPATKKMNFAEHPYNNLRNRFGATLTDNGFDLLNSFLTYDPNRRISAEDALQHEYFKETPSPVDPSLFPSWPARSEGAKRAKKASPKAPEGGNFYKGLSEDGDGAFHMPAGKPQGRSSVPGFTLKF